MDTSSSNTVDIIENQILKAINNIKYCSKKIPCTLKIFNYLKNNYASNYVYHSFGDTLNELKSNRIIDDSYKIINPIQEIINFVTEDEVIIYSETSEDESNDSHRTATSPKISRPEITTQVDKYEHYSRTTEPDFNVTMVQLQSLENKLFSKILAPKLYFMDEILNLNIVTRNNIVWKLVRGYCLCYCKSFWLVPDSTECTKLLSMIHLV